jgi:hypothetical protein
VLKVQTWNNYLTLCHYVHQNHPFCKRKVTMTFPAEGLTWNFFFQKRIWTMPFQWLSFHAGHTDGSTRHPQWRSVKENFHVQARNGRGRLTTPFPAHFCVIQLGFMETNEYTRLNTLKHQWCFSQSKLTREQITEILYWFLLTYRRFCKTSWAQKANIL